LLIFSPSEVRKPLSLYRAPCTWAIANAYRLSVYTLITLSFLYLSPWVNAISSDFWSEVPCPSAWAHMVQSRVTTAAPEYLILLVIKLELIWLISGNIIRSDQRLWCFQEFLGSQVPKIPTLVF
jgi:hypothetical protein